MFVEKELTPKLDKKRKKRKSNVFSEVEISSTATATPPKKSKQNQKKSVHKEPDEKVSRKGKKKDAALKKEGDIKAEEDYDYMSLLMNSKDELDELNESEAGFVVEDDDMEETRGQQDFIEAMSSIHGKKKKIILNRGSNLQHTEDSVPQTDRVELSDLLNTLDTDTRALSRRAEGEVVSAPLPTPLERPAAERVTRQAGYTRVREEVNIWDAVVHGRRLAETVSFPLVNPDLRLQTAEQVVRTRFNASTPLEQQVAAMLAGSRAVVQPGQELSLIEKKGLEGLTPRELAERKAELAKFRALQTYQEAKYRRQNKIKSKKFRKIARKEKNKEKLKELERLAETDPQAAAEELERLDRKRIEERASLKHRNANRFLKDQAKRAKVTKDKDIQGVVQEQLQKHRELVSKGRLVSDSEEEEEDEDDGVHVDTSKLELDQGEEAESFTEFSASYKKFWEAEKQKAEASGREEIEDMFEEAEHSVKQRIRQTGLRLEEEDQEDEEEGEDHTEETGLEHAESLNPAKNSNKIRPEKSSKPPVAAARNEVDPDNFMSMKSKTLKSDLPEIYGYNEEDESDEELDQRRVIAEAFAEDDVLADFQKEKAELIAASKPKDIDLTLPGWGEWGGGGLEPSKRKRKRFTIKAPPAEKRRDENKGNLIINVDKDTKIRAHKVNKVPFPFSSVSDFEASIRAPIGSTFLPRTAFLKMVKPKVTTKMGDVITPMDRSQLLRRNIIQHV